MKRWEYYEATCEKMQRAEVCNLLGQDGWELASSSFVRLPQPEKILAAADDDRGWVLMFKRELPAVTSGENIGEFGHTVLRPAGVLAPV